MRDRRHILLMLVQNQGNGHVLNVGYFDLESSCGVEFDERLNQANSVRKRDACAFRLASAK